ncbi:MAG: hypothetical protein ABI210_11435 [Abditibacteriaceae bacterium]
MTNWQCALELDESRKIVTGSEANLAAAIGRGADLRVYTEFRYNEHIDVTSDNTEMMREVSEFGITYLLDKRWAAGIMNLRQPIELPDGFGPRPSMSFFLYNQNGQQAVARPYLDGTEVNGIMGAAPAQIPENMPRYHAQQSFDAGTNAPSSNFIYDFGCYRFLVEDSWREVFSHDKSGAVLEGSLSDLVSAFSQGLDIKIGVSGLCDELQIDETKINHEVFIKAGYSYYNTERRMFTVGTQPIVRVGPSIPLLYGSQNWDFGWLMARSDGHVAYRKCDPYTLQFNDQVGHQVIRWFVRGTSESI